MKRCWYGLGCALLLQLIYADNDGITSSILKPRAITSNNTFQNNLRLYWWYHTIMCEHTRVSWMIQVSPFYQYSLQSGKLASFLLPTGTSNISVRQNGTGDVGSPWINLVAADADLFSSCVAIKPIRSVVGTYVDFRFDLSQFSCHYWFDLAFAAFRAKHRLHISQTPSEHTGVICGLTNAIQALDQPGWHYGKFAPCTLTAQGIDTVQLQWGYDWFYCDTNHLSPYIVVTVPTHDNNVPEYVFEPIVHTLHTSIGAGLIGDYKIIDAGCELTFLFDLRYRYELSAYELRSFDLCRNGPWSRYLKVTREDNPTCAYAGINFFTLPARITPKSTVDFWTTLHFVYSKMHVELGYDFWWRQQERATVCCLPGHWGIYDIAGAQEGNPVSASNARIWQSTIGNVAPSDATFVAVTLSDINLATGSAPSAISNTIYIAGSYNGSIGRFPSYIGLGSSLEFAHNAFSNWACWISIAASF